MSISCILLLAGEGKRFHSDTPKQYIPLAGKAIYLHALETLQKSNLFDEIILVCHGKRIATVRSSVPETIRVVVGGATRQASTYAGLQACAPDTRIVLIHDGVRPFVTEQILRANIEAARRFGAVDTCITSDDTIVQKTDGFIEAIPNRDTMLRGQTPQTFSYPLIMQAHRQTTRSNASDDCGLVHALGHKVAIVEGHRENIKITTQLDFFLAEQIFRLRHAAIPQGNGNCSGKIYAVTGGTGDIGSAIVRRLTRLGAKVYTLSPSSPDFPVNLGNYAQTKAAFDAIGALDGLINCAGLLKVGAFSDMSPQEIPPLIESNLTATIHACHAAHMRSGAHILNISSSSYTRGRENYALYSAAKAAIVNFTQALAEERQDLAINVLVPARTASKMRRDNFPEEDRSELLTPEEVAEKVCSIVGGSHSSASTYFLRRSLSATTAQP